MRKYFKIFEISFQQEFAYKASFILWRFRNVIQILVFFFLWDAVFTGRNNVFGYGRSEIFTYAFVLIIVRALVFSSRSVDVAGQIANGELTNILLKPVNYFYYWMTRDLSSKFLNIVFGVIETVFLVIILKPNVFLQNNFVLVILFIASIIIAMFLYFCISLLTSFVPFWVPELSWGAQFLMLVVVAEFLSGAFFPLDVFPPLIFQILRFTPFPYLIFIPIKIYLGSFDGAMVFQSLLIGACWCFVLAKIMNYVWHKGLREYHSVGR